MHCSSMPRIRKLLCAVAAAVATALPGNGLAQADRLGNPELDTLFQRLKSVGPEEAAEVERQIAAAWSESGSAAMDLLLERGRKAMSEGDQSAAIRQFSALTDHAPEFAEGWNARATAHYLAGQFDLSLQDIGRTLQLEPRHFGAINGYALIMEARREYAAALRAYEILRSIHPQRKGLSQAIARLQQKLFDQSA